MKLKIQWRGWWRLIFKRPQHYKWKGGNHIIIVKSIGSIGIGIGLQGGFKFVMVVYRYSFHLTSLRFLKHKSCNLLYNIYLPIRLNLVHLPHTFLWYQNRRTFYLPNCLSTDRRSPLRPREDLTTSYQSGKELLHPLILIYNAINF